MTLRQAAEEFVTGRKALRELSEISSDRKIGKKMKIHVSTVIRAYSGLPVRICADDVRLCVALKTEQRRLRTVQQASTIKRLAVRYSVRQADIVYELERMGVEV